MSGRDRELDALERLLSEACTGSARAVFVSGEPGIGKTYVLAELVRRAEARGCLVLEGSAAEFEQALPFGVAVRARRGVELARALGEGHVYPTLFPCLGTSTWVAGRLAESAEILDAAIESARTSGNVQSIVWGLFNGALGALMAGDIDLALKLSEESVKLARALGEKLRGGVRRDDLRLGPVRARRSPVRAADVLVSYGGEDLARIAGAEQVGLPRYLEVPAR